MIWWTDGERAATARRRGRAKRGAPKSWPGPASWAGIAARAGVAIAIMAAGGCGVYSASSGRLDPSLRRIAVPYLQNQSAEPNLEVQLTDAIVRALQDDNTLKVVPENDSDTVLSGRIISYRVREAFTTQELQVDQYQVQILVELTLVRRATGDKLIDKRRLTGTGNYVLNQSTEAEARDLAAAQIVREVVALIVEDW
jgi:hypothetical protein